MGRNSAIQDSTRTKKDEKLARKNSKSNREKGKRIGVERNQRGVEIRAVAKTKRRYFAKKENLKKKRTPGKELEKKKDRPGKMVTPEREVIMRQSVKQEAGSGKVAGYV